MAKQPNQKNIKICLVGSEGVGKSTFLTRHRTGDFERKYVATAGVEIHSIPFRTNHGRVNFNVWDCAGQEYYGRLHEGYYDGVQAIVVFFDVTSRLSYRNAKKWLEEMRTKMPSVLLLLVGNKVDCQEERKVYPEYDHLHWEFKCQYYDISVKSNYNVEYPFVYILHQLMGKDTIIDKTNKYVKEEIIEDKNNKRVRAQHIRAQIAVLTQELHQLEGEILEDLNRYISFKNL